jgi:hypothetical protein
MPCSPPTGKGFSSLSLPCWALRKQKLYREGSFRFLVFLVCHISDKRGQTSAKGTWCLRALRGRWSEGTHTRAGYRTGHERVQTIETLFTTFFKGSLLSDVVAERSQRRQMQVRFRRVLVAQPPALLAGTGACCYPARSIVGCERFFCPEAPAHIIFTASMSMLPSGFACGHQSASAL